MDVWQRTNAGGGGAFNSPVIDAVTGHWAVGSDLSGAYLSADQGASWQVIGAHQGLVDTHVSALAFLAGGQLLIGTEHGLDIATADGGRSTHVADLGYVSALAVSHDGSVAYTVVHPGWDRLEPQVWRSDDGGWTWLPTGADLPGDLRITGARVHPTDPSALMVLSAEGRWPEDIDVPNRVYLSGDRGAHFTRIDPDLAEVYDVRYDLSTPNRVWLTVGAGSDGALLRSEDAGWSWTTVSTGRSGEIWLDPTRPDRVRLVEVTGHAADDTSGGLWESTDGGATFALTSAVGDWDTHWPGWIWSYAESFQGLAQTVGFSEGNPDVALWVTTQWAFASRDGRTFGTAMGRHDGSGFVSSGIDNIVPYGVAPSAADPSLVYSYNWDIGCQRSDDAGGHWWPCNQTWVGGVRTSAWEQDNGGDVMSLAPDPTRRNVVWATMTPDRTAPAVRLVRSDAAGTPGSWALSDSGLPAAHYIGGLAVDPASPEVARTLYVVADGVVYRSVDDGWTWSAVADCGRSGTSGCQAVWIAAPGVVFAGGGAGLFRSAGGGEPGTWAEVGALPGDPWLIEPWLDGFAGVSDVTTDPRDPSVIWVAVTGDGFYRSGDGGAGFARIRDDRWARAVAVGGDGRVWTASSSATFHGGWDAASSGVQVSADGGATWADANQGWSWPTVLDLEFGADGALWGANAGLGTGRRMG